MIRVSFPAFIPYTPPLNHSSAFHPRTSFEQHIFPHIYRVSRFKSFNVITATLYDHYDEVLNFFVSRATNAFAESFNAKLLTEG